MMLFKYILCFVCFISICKGQDFIEARCTIFDREGRLIKSFTGSLCGYLDDGRRVEVDKVQIRLFDSSDKLRWTAKGLFHHDFKFDQNQKDILVLNETAHSILGCRTRFDTISRFDLASGELKQTIDFHKYFQSHSIELQRRISILNKSIFRKIEGKYECSTTHVNSIYQIEANILQAKNPIYKKGNWLVHLGWTGLILVFDQDFKKILGQHFVNLDNYRFHDVQFTKEGKILLYINSLKENENFSTVIAMIDPIKKGNDGIEIIRLAVDGKSFHQPELGGIQLMDNGEKIVSIYTPQKGYEAGVFDLNWKLTKRLTLFPEAKSKLGQDFQVAKVFNLHKFLKNYSGD